MCKKEFGLEGRERFGTVSLTESQDSARSQQKGRGP